ncbi:MAG: response regulator [Proteobacteria bacterium]|nr:response regulator [Pseudomonadota bacterium]
MKKRILFVDDDNKLLQELKHMLAFMSNEWEMDFVDSGKMALEAMAKSPYAVIVSDMQMPEMDGPELLTRVMKLYPSTLRIVLSDQVEKKAMLRSIGPSHQYLSKPCDAKLLKETVTRASALRDILSSDRLAFVANMKTLPSLPKIYQELMEEMQSEEPSIRAISQLIEKDIAMTAKILQLVNSAYFGVRRHISNPAMAVNLLGLQNVRSLVLFANVFSQMDARVSASNFSMDKMWKHSSAVGRLCQEILKAEKKGKQAMDDALTAGLLHDCGKLVLAANLGKKYEETLNLSNDECMPLCEAEFEIIGASHAEVGACLLAIWGLPEAIVEAVAFHHTPSQCLTEDINALTAVHVSNALTQEQGVEGGQSGVALLDFGYIESIGIGDRIATWSTLDL